VTGGRLNLRVSPTPEAAGRDHAEAFAAAARQAVAERGAFHVALSGGSTPRLMYSPLRQLDVPWAQVHIYFSDERSVGPDSEQSNYRSARQHLLDHVPVPTSQVHRMEGERDPAQAAADYAALLPAQLDAVLLGMGDDGHTASLFPGSAGLTAGGRVIANWVQAQQTWRLTFTFDEINAARARWLLVTGASKQPVMAELQEGQGDYPVRRVQDPVWFVDQAAVGRRP
jgi:6-phosphogluconolactonase